MVVQQSAALGHIKIRRKVKPSAIGTHQVSIVNTYKVYNNTLIVASRLSSLIVSGANRIKDQCTKN